MSSLTEYVPETYECPTCGESYKRPGRHWSAGNDCDWPAIPDELRQRLDALAVAGATADGNESTRLRVWTTSRERARWLSSELGWLVNAVRQREHTDKQDQYVVSTMAHPALNSYQSWAGRGVPPEDVSWTPTFGRVWYSLAGGLGATETRQIPALYIMARADDDRLAALAQLLEDGGYPVRTGDEQLIVAPTKARRLLADIGPPAPGTVYKWVLDSDLRAVAREQAGSGDPLWRTGDDEAQALKHLLRFVGERRYIVDPDNYERLVAPPSADHIADVLGGGSWESALRVAGVHGRPQADQPNDISSGQSHNATLADMLTVVRRMQDDLGSWPTPDEYRSHKREGDPSVAWLYASEPDGVADWPALIERAQQSQ